MLDDPIGGSGYGPISRPRSQSLRIGAALNLATEHSEKPANSDAGFAQISSQMSLLDELVSRIELTESLWPILGMQIDGYPPMQNLRSINPSQEHNHHI